MLAKELSTGVQRAQPCFIEPMQVTPARVLPDGSAWTYEAKFDGYRCLAAKTGSGALLWSRRGNEFTTRFREIARACETLLPNTLIAMWTRF
jgi:bifunctional non-homologous end joining protein LigD